MKKIIICALSMLMALSMYSGQTKVNAKTSQSPFYGIWISASKNSSAASSELKKAKNHGFSKAKIYVSTDWENLNSSKYYVISTNKYKTKASATQALKKVKRYYTGAYIKYTGKYKTAKITKVDQMMIAVKNKQYLKASKIMKTLPEYCTTTGKLSKKTKQLYKSKCKKMKLNGYWYYDINGDGKADLFTWDVWHVIRAYTEKNNKLVKLGSFRVNPNNWFTACPGTDHFYMANIMNNPSDLFKVTYKNGKFKITLFTKYDSTKYDLMGFTYDFR